eukprot:364023-Chlamydomonas_euryale.AAC.12
MQDAVPAACNASERMHDAVPPACAAGCKVGRRVEDGVTKVRRRPRVPPQRPHQSKGAAN